MVSAKWSQSGHQEVVNLGFLLVSQILKHVKSDKNLTYKKLKTHTHLSGPGLPKGALFF